MFGVGVGGSYSISEYFSLAARSPDPSPRGRARGRAEADPPAPPKQTLIARNMYTLRQ